MSRLVTYYVSGVLPDGTGVISASTIPNGLPDGPSEMVVDATWGRFRNDHPTAVDVAGYWGEPYVMPECGADG